ncbi:MAG: prepilin peptidase [Hyphomonadaceae bacterium]|nr:prepilin peptidase [Hyphomonadaceae bacterium]
MVFVFGLILLALLTCLSWVDFRTCRLPDILTLPLIAAGLVQAYSGGFFLAGLIGAVAGYSVFVGIELLFKRIRKKDGLGRGDAKLLAAGGAWVGWMFLPFIVMIGSSLGLIAAMFPSMRNRTGSGHIPFGPFLALAIFIVWAAGHFARR